MTKPNTNDLREEIRNLPFKLIGASDIKTFGEFLDVISSEKYANTKEIVDELYTLFTNHTARVVREARALNYIGGCICPCQLSTPCSDQCTCANPVMSGGCSRCATYGNPGQRQASADRLATLNQTPQPQTKPQEGEYNE